MYVGNLLGSSTLAQLSFFLSSVRSTLSEKIIKALPKLKCPHRLEPHQIQGSDFINIFPVMQWLVKKVLETREEMSDYVRNFSEIQFGKDHQAPEDIAYLEKKQDSTEYMTDMKERYRPQRQFKGQGQGRRHWSSSQASSTIEKTLLEYGQRYLSSSTQDGSKGGKEAQEKAKEAEEERRRIDALVEQMKRVDIDSSNGASSSAVGSIVGMESEFIKQVREFVTILLFLFSIKKRRKMIYGFPAL